MSESWDDTTATEKPRIEEEDNIQEECGDVIEEDAIIKEEEVSEEDIDIKPPPLHEDGQVEAALNEEDQEEGNFPHESNPAAAGSVNGEEEDANNEGEDVIDDANNENGSGAKEGEEAVEGEEGEEEEEPMSDTEPSPYPGAPPPGYEHYPPPPGYYPYPPHYPPHPAYGYHPPPPPPGYYPPPPGYYPPPGHPPHHPLQAPPSGERDPSTGNFIYGGPPPSDIGPAKRSRMRIKTPQDIMNRKVRKNAQSRNRAARLRDKVDTIKIKGNDEMTEDEVRIYSTVEERRARKNNRSRERALEKKAELERIIGLPESERTAEEIETLNITINAKKRKNEGDRLRRERLKKMGLKVKPPGVSIRSRPRKPLSGENILPYGNPPLAMGMPPLGMPVVGGGEMAPPVLPPLLHAGADTFQYPPAPIPHAYPPPNSYYAEPPPMKDDNDDNVEGHGDTDEGNLDYIPGSANAEQEVSELLLEDHDVVGGEQDAGDEHIKEEEIGTIEC